MPESLQRIAVEMRRNYRTSEAWWSGAAGIEPPGGDDDTAKHFSTSSSRSAAQRAWLFVKSAMGMAMKADRHVAGVVAFQPGNGVRRHCFLLARTRRGA